MKQEHKSNNNSSKLCCNYCYSEHVDFCKLRKHLRAAHKVDLTPLISKLKHKNVKPDPDDPNFYCQSCEAKFLHRKGYRDHLFSVHKMKVGKKVLASLRNIKPDLNNPNFYCKSGDRKYINNGRYRMHLRAVHKLDLTPLRITKPDKNITPVVNDLNFYCKSCDVKFQSKEIYQKHLRFSRHKTLAKPRSRVNHGIMSDVNDPNFYCKSCSTKYLSRRKYRQHLKNIHRIDLVAQKEEDKHSN